MKGFKRISFGYNKRTSKDGQSLKIETPYGCVYLVQHVNEEQPATLHGVLTVALEPDGNRYGEDSITLPVTMNSRGHVEQGVTVLMGARENVRAQCGLWMTKERPRKPKTQRRVKGGE